MDAPQTMWILCVIALFLFTCSVSADNVPKDQTEDKKLELFDGVHVNIPKDDNEKRMLSLEVDTNQSLSEGRGKKKKLMQRILPMFIMPFILQSAIIPLVLGMLKFMLLKSSLVGKLALALIIFNAFKNHNSFNGRDAEMASAHYGYHGDGMEHYASYLN